MRSYPPQVRRSFRVPIAGIFLLPVQNQPSRKEPAASDNDLTGQSLARIVFKIASRQQGWLDGCQDCLGIVGNAQHATASTRRDVISSAVLVMSLTLSTRDGRGAPEVDRALRGDVSTCDPSTTQGKQVHQIITTRAVTSWGNPTTRLWQVVWAGRPTSMQKAVIQGYVGNAIDPSDHVHTVLEGMESHRLLGLRAPRRGRRHLSLSQHLSTLGHAIVTMATRGLPKDAGPPRSVRPHGGSPRGILSPG